MSCPPVSQRLLQCPPILSRPEAMDPRTWWQVANLAVKLACNRVGDYEVTSSRRSQSVGLEQAEGRLCCHAPIARRPPSIPNVEPVMNEASSESSHATAFATSS